MDWLRETSGTKLHMTIPLGVDLAAFDRAAAAGAALPDVRARFTKPEGEVWLAYTGSLNRNYDFLTIIHAAARLRATLARPVRYFLTSRGEMSGEAERVIRGYGLTNVTLTGFLDFAVWAHLLTQCDAGFNASFPDAFIFLPNKIFYYLAAGVAVLNTIPGQCSQIVADGHFGLDYVAGDVAGCAAAIQRVVHNEPARREMRSAARRAAETHFDRAVLYPRYAKLIEKLVPSSVTDPYQFRCTSTPGDSS